MHHERDEDIHYGCLKCGREEIYARQLCRRHWNVERILKELLSEEQ